MMTKYTYKCDKCGKETESVKSGKPDDWESVSIAVGVTSRYSNGRLHSAYDLCPECLAKLGVPPKETQINNDQKATTERRLYDVFREIAAEAECRQQQQQQ